MTLIIDMPEIDAAIAAESWEWLEDNNFQIARAVAKSVQRGRTPEQIKRHIAKRTSRYSLALRCEQAAQHLVNEAAQ